MLTSHASVLHRRNSAPLGRRLTAAVASAIALVALLSGSAAAYPLDRDDGVRTPSSPCQLDPGVVLDRHLIAKLRTTAGCAVLALG